MKVLVTGFDPFGGESINPAFEVIKRLPNKIEGAQIVKLEVPTVFEESIKKASEAIDQEKPDIVLCIGQAGGRFGITPERVAINCDDARIPDNKGNQPLSQSIREDGAPAYFATLPIKTITQNVKEKGIPAMVSNSAGTFVCNHLMYGVLYHIAKNNYDMKAGFIHIPFLLEQVVDKPGKPGFSLSSLVVGIEEALRTCILDKEDNISLVSGTLH